MKPTRVVAIAILLALVLVNFGNACSSSFQTIDDQASSNGVLSCQSDEGSMISLVQDWKLGYLGERQVLYFERGDGWIQVEGDMLYPSDGPLPSQPPKKGISQGVGVAKAKTWPNGKVPYVVSGSLPNQQRITDAVNHWNNNLNGYVKFVARTTETDYAQFNYVASGCSSSVGYYAGRGAHPVSISNDCGSGNVAHEMGHVLGLDHEQNRHDRDSYVTINWAKIQSGYSNNFQQTASEVDYNGYDFGSIMHYTLTSFSTDGSQTITPKVSIPSGTVVGQRQGLSSGDIAAVKIMYATTSPTPTPTPTPSVTPTPTPSASPTPTPSAASGLFGHYYDGVDFRNLKTERRDTQVDFDWGTGMPASNVGADDFSVKWSGWVQPTVGGNYAFVIAGQDAYRLKINGAVVIDNLAGSGASEMSSVQQSLVAGQAYRIDIEFISRTGSSSMHLKWRKDSSGAVAIPAANLIPDTSSFVGDPCSGN